MWKLTIEDDEGKQTALPLAHEEYALGRGESNAIRLTDRNISRAHAALKKNGQGWFLKDLQSYNGTYINGVRVVGEQVVHSGDLVQLGDYRLELLDEAAVPGSAQNANAPTHIPPVHQRPNRLVIVVGPTPGAEFPLDKEHFTIGRSEEATISINHSSVSRVHAELLALGNGRFEIVDKASANGIRINGVELKRGILEAGDALELGDVRLRFVGAGKIFRAGIVAAGSFESVAPSVQTPGSGKPGMTIGKLVAVGILIGIVLMGAWWLLRSGPSTPEGNDPKHPGSQMSEDAAKKQLSDAHDKLNNKDFEGAHKQVLEIPESSPVREETAFKEIEAAWADWIFQRVDSVADNTEKKKLLKEINTTPSVDAERRKKAAEMIAEIEAKEPPPSAPQLPYNPGLSSSGAPGGSSSARVDPISIPSGGVMQQGLTGEDAQRKVLEPRVFSGKATLDEIKMLRAICKHLGNRDCKDRADAILRKKMQEQPQP